jgi:diguanylate cyclase (GGDEF)-like protein/PAS domain S-box-containing protein
MKRLRVSATLRVAIGLAFIATTVLLVSYSTGMIPDVDQEKIKSRLTQCETIAICASVQARQDETHRMEKVLEAIAQRNDDIRSIGIRRASGFLVTEIGDHTQHWDEATASRGSNTFVMVPVYTSSHEHWGTIEVRFKELARSGIARLSQDPCFRLFLAFPAAMVLLTYLYLRKMLRHMDPSKAVPSRVRSALDTLTGGLLIIDSKGQIVLANSAFVEASGCSADELQGKPVSDLDWSDAKSDDQEIEFDWLTSMREGKAQPSVMLQLNGPTPRTLMVNCAPILSEAGSCRGVLASLEDVTELKNKEVELEGMLQELTHSQKEISTHNEHLRALAMQDPLTECMNRRAFFERFEQEWSRAARYGHDLSCVILDLDYFKSINDNHGHGAGDEVLKSVGKVLTDTARDVDFVCRYGGEEFCVMLPHVGNEGALIAAERFRAAIEKNVSVSDINVTASIGVSALSLGAEHPQAMVEQADIALYSAKHQGRNRVVCFSEVPDGMRPDESQIARTNPATIEDDMDIPFHAVTALISALGYRDSSIAEHSRRVADLCVDVGKRMLSSNECYVLEIAALLHDIGKIGVPDSVLQKPGPLDHDEWDVMSVHDQMGIEIIESAFGSPELTGIVKSQHAHYGGKGRHDDLPVGNEIPLAARILAIANTYDSITTDRPYRKACTAEAAFAELRRCAGTQFDPDVVEKFIESLQASTPVDSNRHPQAAKQTVLQLGTQVERLTQALGNDDCESLQQLLGRLKVTAQAGSVHDIAETVTALESAVGKDSDAANVLAITNELLSLCRSAQRELIGSDSPAGQVETNGPETNGPETNEGVSH